MFQKVHLEMMTVHPYAGAFLPEMAVSSVEGATAPMRLVM